MMRSSKDLIGYGILATDGELGSVHDLYFDEDTWTIRYLVVDTGTWLAGTKVLISTEALGQPEWETHHLPVHLTKEQVQNSPGVDMARPISREYETVLRKYYGWHFYWWPASMGSGMTVSGTPIGAFPIVTPLSENPENIPPDTIEKETHIRSIGEVMNYSIHSLDGDVGKVEDIVSSDQSWKIHYVVADVGNWLTDRKVLVDPKWIYRIDWYTQKIFIDLSKDVIQNSPEFDPTTPINRNYEVRLYDYYGRPRY